MSVCEATRPAPLRCPTAPEILASALKILPKGRAWQSNEGGPRVGAWLYRFWQSVAEAFAFANQRLCDLRLEFWCATHNETHDLWMAEYGLPDACDPFPDLCAKVAAMGGTRCEYYAAVAARAGWSVACVINNKRCGSKAGCARAGNAVAGGGASSSRIQLIVNLAASPAYKGVPRLLPKAGRMKAGRAMKCAPSIEPLECIMSRVVHAEIEITYGIIEL